MQNIIEQAWQDRNLLNNEDTQAAIREVIEALDKGKLSGHGRIIYRMLPGFHR